MAVQQEKQSEAEAGDLSTLRKEILALVGRYGEAAFVSRQFVAGQSTVPPS